MSVSVPLVDRFFLSLHVTAAEAPCVLSGLETLPVLSLAPGEWLVPLPGWIWAGRHPETTPALRLSDGGALPDLNHDMLQERLARMAQTPVADLPAHDLVRALEHVHYAGLFAQLPDSLQQVMVAAASATGLSRLLPLPPRPTPAEGALNRCIRLFGQKRRETPEADPIDVLADLLVRVPLDPEDRLVLSHELTAHFCDLDRVRDLYDLLNQTGAGAIRPDWDRPWRLGSGLPGLLLQGDYRAVREVIEHLARTPNLWAPTQAVAWTLRHLLSAQAPFLPTDDFEAILIGGLTYIEAQAARPYGVAPCVALQAAVLCLLDRESEMSERVRTRIVGTVLRAYGMSADFWAQVGTRLAQGQALPPEVLAGYQMFRRLRKNLGRSDALISAALRGLRGIGAEGAERAHADLLGPLGVGHSEALLPADRWLSDADGTDAALLRGLVAPYPQQVQGLTAVRQRRMLMSAEPTLPVPRYAGARGALTEAAFGLLQQASLTPVDPLSAPAADLAGRLERQAGQGADFLGSILFLSLLHDLIQRQALPAAWSLVHAFERVLRRVTHNMGDGLAQVPGLRQATARLRQVAVDGCPGATVLGWLPPALQLAARQDAGIMAGELAAHWARAPVLFDTLVVVCSGRRRLETHVPGLRDGWLRDLDRLGIPYVILAGGFARTALQGDVLQVAGPDTPDGRSDRILAMLDWVRSQTAFGHVLKIDDDCVLDAEGYFFGQGYRSVAYHGAPPRPEREYPERMLHQKTALGRRARLAFDCLPREVSHAAGRTGYALSRQALEALHQQRATLEGQHLEHCAFAEDRLVGALLNRAGIRLHSDPGMAAEFEPVGATLRHRQGLLNGALVTHLGKAGKAPADLRRGKLWPPMIWPSDQAPRLGRDGNGLQLLSSPRRLEEAAQAELAIVTTLRNEMFILPHFLQHYRRMGVSYFMIVDNCSDDGSTEYLLDQPDVVLFSAAGSFRDAAQGTDWKIALMAQYRMDRWTLVADADEFLLLPTVAAPSLPVYLRQYRTMDVDAIRVLMLDMYPKGPLAQADFAGGDPFTEAGFVDARPFLRASLSRGPYSNSTTWTSALRHRLMPGSRPDLFVSQKVPLLRYRPWTRLSLSLHYAAEVTLAPQDLLFAHFKYHADFHAKARREIHRGQYYNNAEEYRKYLDLTAAGQVGLYDPDISVPWRDCAAVRRSLAGTATRQNTAPDQPGLAMPTG